ncbi:VWA domain-containing protein [bacterium D16-54]|nr:VWA domain-containing protein [bacterium D16-54]RKJ16808.1 VWA domain-containing protein [bacterium D16-56]
MKRKKQTLLSFLLTTLFILSFLAPAYGGQEDDSSEEPLAPYFFIEDADPQADQFPLKETLVSTTINGVIAETFVTQTYANQGMNSINARYIFPASDRVSIHGMKMQIEDQIITAQIQEQKEARQTFEKAKSEGKSASLLEQQRPNVFSMDVANIMPGDTVRIELHYTELISPTEGVYQFVFPTVVGPRYASSSAEEAPDSTHSQKNESDSGPGSKEEEPDQWLSSPYLEEDSFPPGKYDITVKLSTGVPITDISSDSHSIKLEKISEDKADITLADPEEYGGNRDFILNYKLTGQEVNCGLLLDCEDDENFFMLMVQPPEHYTPENLPPREYIFIVDVSGSMFGYPLSISKNLIGKLVSSLKPEDRFNLLLFSNSSIQMSPRSVPAAAENISRAIDLINEESGGGGTELAPALRNAISIPRAESYSRSIVIITDGYISGEKEIFNIIHDNLDNTSFFAFGIGDSVNRYLINGIAGAGQGEAFVVTNQEEANDTLGRFLSYVHAPLLTDIQITYDGFDAYDVEPSMIPTLFAKRPIVVFGKWRGQPEGTIRITGKTNGQDYVKEIPVSQSEPSSSNQAIRYLWARKMVERLTDYGGRGTDSKLAKILVTSLGLKYSMMTPYTSFVAVTETISNPDGAGSDVKQPSVLPLHVSNLSVGGYTTGSEPGTVLLILGIALLMLCRILRYKKS